MTGPAIVAVLRTFLYSVLFSDDLRAEVPRTIAYFRLNGDDHLRVHLRVLAEELANPTVEARATDELLLRFPEAEIRAYLAAVVDGLTEPDEPQPNGGAQPGSAGS